MKCFYFLKTACVCCMLFTSISHAALIDRGGGLIYDDDLNITWLSDANYSRTSGFDTDGLMNWAGATSWADGLSYVDSVRNTTWDDWRLPTTLTTDTSCTDDTAGSTNSSDAAGYNCTGSEMGHLFYNELGGTAGISILSSGDPDVSSFTNIQGTSTLPAYWSGTFTSPSAFHPWVFLYSDGGNSGLQSFNHQNSLHFAWAVRDGDVGAAPAVPLPPGVLLFGSGLIALIGMLRRKPGQLQ